jgi:hypothetical protein
MPKMALHWPFGHLQPKLWAKEGPGIKLPVWLPTIKSQESIFSQCRLKECNMALKSSRQELQLWLRPCPDPSLGRRATSVQSSRTPTRDSFGTPTWESREKKPFGCSLSGELQSILYGGRWWLPPESGPWWVLCVKVPLAWPNTQRCSRMLTNLLVVGFGCRFKLDLLVHLPSLIPGLLARPSTPF